MMNRSLYALAILAISLSAGCGKEESKDDKTNDSKPAAKADDKAAADKPTTEGDDKAGSDEQICCEFGGAIGTSTKAKCDEFKGKVVEGLAPPCKQ